MMTKTRQLIKDQAGDALLVIVAGLLVTGIVGLTIWRVRVHHKHTTPAPSTVSSTSSTSNAASDMTTGSSNGNLATDLNNVNTSLGQEGGSQTIATGALNDQQSQISVPTN